MILVTGASGFIGSHVAQQLLDAGRRVRTIVRGDGHRDNLAPLQARGLEVSYGDLLEPTSIERALDGVKVVYHIAGWISTKRRDAERLHELNYAATQHLWKACRAAKVERIVYLGSIFALGGDSQQPLDEDARYTLDSLPVPYFKAKRRAELLTRHEIARDLPVVSAYPGFCLGPGDVYLSSMRALELQHRLPMPAVLDGGMAFVDVRDAAAGLLLAESRGQLGRRYLLTGRNLTWYELLSWTAHLLGRTRPQLVVPRRAARPLLALVERLWGEAPFDEASAEVMGRFYYYDDRRARSELGWETRPLGTTLRDAVDWLKARSEAA